MTSCSEQEDLAPEEALGVLCRCGHLLTDTDLYFCGYCGSPIVTTSGRRRAPAAVVSGRRAALAALASERSAGADEPTTQRFAVLATPVTPATTATPAATATPPEEGASDPAAAPEPGVAVAAAAAPPSVKRAARAARANRRSRHAGGVRSATTAVAVAAADPTAAPAEPPGPASDDRVTVPPVDEPTAAVAAAPPEPSAAHSAAPAPVDEADPEPEAEPQVEVAPRASVSDRRTWPAWLAVVVIVGASAVRTVLGLLFTFPAYLTWLPVVLVAVLAFAKVARFSVGLVGVATAAVTTWWFVDHVVSTARLQDLGYDVGYTTITVPLLVAAVGTVPLAVVLGALVDGDVRTTLREWVVGRGGVDTVRAAAVVLALLAALFPVVRSGSAEPGFAVLTAARDQVLVPGYPTPGQIADQMHATSVAKGRPVSVTCTYAPPDVVPRPSYRCVAVSTAGGEAAQVHDGILSTGRPDGTYTCVDLTRGVDRRLC